MHCNNKNNHNLDELIKGILDKDCKTLSQVITIAESKKKEDRMLFKQLLSNLPNVITNSFCIGITGTPGVGKSTFIDNIGALLLDQNKTLGVITIDPSSKISGGSILGDKTRMSTLIKSEKAFIRPLADEDSQEGGVNQRTREIIRVFQAAKFDYIFVETVGTGQSEVSIKNMVDMLILLILPSYASGDELQGIKKGVLELADMIVINKSYGIYENEAKKTQEMYKVIFHYANQYQSQYYQQIYDQYDQYYIDNRDDDDISEDTEKNKIKWKLPILRCSAKEKKGLPEIVEEIEKYQHFMLKNELILKKRKKQLLYWMWSIINYTLIDNFKNDNIVKKAIKQLELDLINGKILPSEAAYKLLQSFGLKNIEL